MKEAGRDAGPSRRAIPSIWARLECNCNIGELFLPDVYSSARTIPPFRDILEGVIGVSSSGPINAFVP
jgi:hypothetical protein